MLRIGLFRYNLIQTSVPVVYTNYFYNIEILSKHGRIQRGGEGTGGPPPTHTPGIARLYVFAMLKFMSDPFWEFGPPPPPGKIFWIRACQTRSFRIFFFFKIITSLANIFSNLFSPREILGFFFYFNTGFHCIYVTTF